MGPVEDMLGRLEARLGEEPGYITQAKSSGTRVIGYFCPYVPEEIILACRDDPDSPSLWWRSGAG